ncbi:MAG: DUF2147 domain-containing protein [Bacteroidota bacterium]
MKKNYFLLFAFLLSPLFLYGQAEKIVGIWLTEKKTSQVEVYKGTDGKYYGKICWLETPNEDGKPKVDKENPDEKLKTRPLLGLNIVNGFKYNAGDKEWEDGTIYDPDNGKTYDCYAWFEDGNYNTLYLKGYVLGIKWMGRSTVWLREPAKK